jgi:hypothetical protein
MIRSKEGGVKEGEQSGENERRNGDGTGEEDGDLNFKTPRLQDLETTRHQTHFRNRSSCHVLCTGE